MQKKNKIIIVIPAYNEEDNILNTYNTIVEYNKKNKTNYDVIVVNDGSKDRTEEILIENKINHIKLIQNLGIGGAVQTGYKYAYENGYDIAVQYDGDGQHDVDYVKTITDPIINDEADFVIGSRFIKKDKDNFNTTFSRRMGINLISFFIKLVTKKKVYDTTSGFRAVNKDIIEFFAHDYPTEYPEPISTTQLLQKKYRLKEVPVKMKARIGGKSSIGSWKNVYYMINVIISIITVDARGRK
ncbi:MAG: glycosyltransferase family 2 protein [Bacilli bacterium]|nr:glycosyltransferase family 2 protein [Bacilli bacterium]